MSCCKKIEQVLMHMQRNWRVLVFVYLQQQHMLTIHLQHVNINYAVAIYIKS